MRQILSIALFVIGQSISAFSQNNRGSVYAQFNTVLIYSNYTINYESKKLFPFKKHSVKIAAGFGGWTTSAFNNNRGLLLNYGVNYLFGSKSHLLEIDINAQNHFDKGLKDQPIVFIGTTLRPFIGYRYQPKEDRYFFKVGTGWREIFQVGFGFRI